MPSASIRPPALVQSQSSWSIAGAHYKHWATSLCNFGVTPFFGGAEVLQHTATSCTHTHNELDGHNSTISNLGAVVPQHTCYIMQHTCNSLHHTCNILQHTWNILHSRSHWPWRAYLHDATSSSRNVTWLMIRDMTHIAGREGATRSPHNLLLEILLGQS